MNEIDEKVKRALEGLRRALNIDPDFSEERVQRAIEGFKRGFIKWLKSRSSLREQSHS